MIDYVITAAFCFVAGMIVMTIILFKFPHLVAMASSKEFSDSIQDMVWEDKKSQK